MLEAGVTGLAEGAREGGHPPPVALAVTVLTSEADVSAFDARLEAAATAGCDGVVCSAREIAVVKAPRRATSRRWCPASGFPARRSTTRRGSATPAEAIGQGADWLVIGRAVTAADDPEAAAEAITRDAADALARGARTRLARGRRGRLIARGRCLY